MLEGRAVWLVLVLLTTLVTTPADSVDTWLGMGQISKNAPGGYNHPPKRQKQQQKHCNVNFYHINYTMKFCFSYACPKVYILKL